MVGKDRLRKGRIDEGKAREGGGFRKRSIEKEEDIGREG